MLVYFTIAGIVDKELAIHHLAGYGKEFWIINKPFSLLIYGVLIS